MNNNTYWFACSVSTRIFMSIVSCFMVSSWVLCKTNTSSASRLRENLEYAAFKHVLLPAYCTWHNLQNRELSYADAVAAGTTAGICYGLKKLNDRTHYITRGAAQGQSIGKSALAYVLNNKAKTVTSVGIVGALWYIYKAMRADALHNVCTIESFFNLLTKEQRATLAQSNSLALLVQQAYDNPILLRESQEFMELLNQKQKSYLDKVISTHEIAHDAWMRCV